MKRICYLLLLTAFLVSCSGFALCDAAGKTRNVILFMTDGLRWQEVFGGADPELTNAENTGRSRIDAIRRAYWRETPEARRAALMPFLWTVVSKQGQLYGNRWKGSDVHVTNGKNFSYPGYSETLCGFPDPEINSNEKIPNRNVTVFEWLNNQPELKGKVAAFGAWDAFAAIFNRDRCGFYINCGFEPVTIGRISPVQALLNRVKAETPSKWDSEPYDSLTFQSALDYLRTNKPRAFYIMLGETDEWAHAGDYAAYLTAANRVDLYLKTLWDTVQSLPEYRDRTTLIVTCDHGRGVAPIEWRNHGAGTKGSEATWIAIIGPDTPPTGERANSPVVTQNQIAATIAALLGKDYLAAVPKAGGPITQALSRILPFQ